MDDITEEITPRNGNATVAQAIAEVMAAARPQTLADVANAVHDILGKPWFDDAQKQDRAAFMWSVTSVLGWTESKYLNVTRELEQARRDLEEKDERLKAALRRIAGYIQDKKKDLELSEQNAALKKQVRELEARLEELGAGMKADKPLVNAEPPSTGDSSGKTVVRKTRNSNFFRKVRA